MKNQLKKNLIGKMDFQGAVDITDPCYDKDEVYRIDGLKIAEGSYDCVVWQEEKPGIILNHIIGIYLDGNIPKKSEMKAFDYIGVDSGSAGFFHDKRDYPDKEWQKFSSELFEGDRWKTVGAWIKDDGFFCLTRGGDGCYDVYKAVKNGEIVALEIRF